MNNLFRKGEQKIQKEGGEREMRKIPMKVVIILTLTLVFTSFCGHQEAMAAFDVSEIWRAVKNVITSTYDGLGRLINKSHVIDSNGVDVDGNSFVTKETIEYDEQNPELIKRRTIETTSTPLEGTLLDKLGVTKEQLDALLKDQKKPYSYSKQIINYSYDANGALTGATGTESIEGQESPWWEYKDAAGHMLTKKADGTYYYVDPVTNSEIAVAEGSVTKTLKVGSSYAGQMKLEFVLVNGEAKVSRRVGDIVYKDSNGKETLTRHIDTLNTYDSEGKLTMSRSWQTDTYPETYKYVDENGKQVDSGTKLFRAQYIETHYEYNADGSLAKVKGFGNGWGLVLTSDGYMVYTSDIAIEYEVINGIARQTKFEESSFYVPAQNPPDPIPQPPAGGDPLGTVIGKFTIHTDHVRAGNQNAGAYNEYEWLVVRLDLDDNGDPAKPDGKLSNDRIYLVRVRTHAGVGQANDGNTHPELKGKYNIGSTIKFLGEAINKNGGIGNRIWKLTSIL